MDTATPISSQSRSTNRGSLAGYLGHPPRLCELFVNYDTQPLTIEQNDCIFLSYSQIALFSAIVTTFFVQSLEGLSQDPGSRTNELLQNLTDVVVAIGSGINASQINFVPPAVFEPEGSAVRLNFYWSISLILSVCVCISLSTKTV